MTKEKFWLLSQLAPVTGSPSSQLVYNTQQPPILILDHFFQFDC